MLKTIPAIACGPFFAFEPTGEIFARPGETLQPEGGHGHVHGERQFILVFIVSL
ncbi:hypothetical protein [Desulfolutivibrio sp.]|uniref:hypothetical protein n=1 Tax=Desulfolutivibrio sp. TaxID=2773296 RepID=UPI002F96114C